MLLNYQNENAILYNGGFSNEYVETKRRGKNDVNNKFILYIKKNRKQRKLEICLQNKIDKVKIEPDTGYDSSRSFKTWKIFVTYTGFILSYFINFDLFCFLGTIVYTSFLHSKYHDSVYS